MNNSPSVESLKLWRSQVAKDIDNIKADLIELQKKQKEAQERLDLIDRLLLLEGHSVNHRWETPANSFDLLDECIKILRESGKPIHINELYNALIERNIPLPGKGTQANVIARLQRSDGQVIRTGRGMYGLPEFGLTAVKPFRKRRKKINNRS